jgi:thioesterase domain-containing protein
MVNPHKDKKTRMTDPHHPQARMLGDVKFHEHKGIDAKAAERFRQRDCEEPLAAFTIQRARSMGYDLPAPDAKLATAPTGEQSAQPRRARRSALVRIQARENGTPIFCIHPAGGTVMCYRDFAKHLGSDYSIYGLQGIGAHGKHFGHKSIEAMAAHYIKEIRTVQPEGPYNLVGWSLGGVVAYEMAQQLRKKKHPIAFLGLVDSDLPRQRRTRSLATRRFLLDFAHQCGLEVSPEVLQNLETEEQLTFLLERAKGGKLIPADLSLERFRQVFERNARIFRANVRALRRYEPQPYSERVVLFQAIDRIGRSLSDQEGTWHALAENVEVHEVLGNHYTIICEPHVRNLTDQIRQYLPRQA